MDNCLTKSCKDCKDYMNCFMNGIGIGIGQFAEECSFFDKVTNREWNDSKEDTKWW